MLAELANKIAQTPTPPKDPDAEDFIRRNIGSRPDALYLMTQTVLIQNMAIQRAQQQIQELQQRAGQSAPMGTGAGPSSFLGQQTTGAPRGYGAPPPSYAAPAAPQYGAPPPQYAAQYAVPTASAPSPSGAGSFLRSAATTAAGVAAGALAFEGIESLFSHHGGGGFGGGSGLMGGQPIEETVVNNYYDDPQGGGGRAGQFADASDLNDAGNLTDVQDTDVQDDIADNAQTEDVDYDDSNTADDYSGSDDNFA